MIIYKLPKGTWIERKLWGGTRWEKLLTTRDAYYDETELTLQLGTGIKFGTGMWHVNLVTGNDHWTLRMRPSTLVKRTKR